MLVFNQALITSKKINQPKHKKTADFYTKELYTD